MNLYHAQLNDASDEEVNKHSEQEYLNAILVEVSRRENENLTRLCSNIQLELVRGLNVANILLKITTLLLFILCVKSLF